MGLATILKRKLIPAEIDEHINRIQKPIGSLGYDPWGYNNEAIKYGFWLTRLIYEKYFRVEAHGVEQVPAEGPVLIIANHSGQLPLDGLLIGYALASRQETPRIPRAMIERFFPTVPWIGNLLNEMGAVLGDPVNCAKMLANGEAVIVFPEGVRGSGKLYRNRYQLKRFGNGFMHLAMKYRPLSCRSAWSAARKPYRPLPTSSRWPECLAFPTRLWPCRWSCRRKSTSISGRRCISTTSTFPRSRSPNGWNRSRPKSAA